MLTQIANLLSYPSPIFYYQIRMPYFDQYHSRFEAAARAEISF